MLESIDNSKASHSSSAVYSARWIFPINAPPIQQGWIRVCDGVVLELGQGSSSDQAIDLGDVAILPGLVNAHTHLEFSDINTPIGQTESGRSQVELHEWIGLVIAQRGIQSAAQKLSSIQAGLAESCDAGVRLIGEITTPPLEQAVWDAIKDVSPKVDIHLLSEVIGLSDSRWKERLATAESITQLDRTAGYSPHAPYSTHPEAIAQAVKQAKKQNRCIAMHVAESPHERELLRNGTGPFMEALVKLGVWPDNLFPHTSSQANPERELEWLIQILARAPRALLVHGNDLTDPELQLIALHDHLTVVYCPRTHWFFNYENHPVDRMLKLGIRVALGTDSRASNPDLKIWGEVQHLLQHRQDIAPEDVLRMATVHGADALGHHDLGRIAAGTKPGLGYVACQSSTLKGVFEDFARNSYFPLQ